VTDTPVAIIGGTGDLGFGLALRFASTHTPVVIGSRRPGAAEDAAERILKVLPDAPVSGRLNSEAANSASMVVVCVPFRAQAENLSSLKDSLQPGNILVDTTVPLAAAVGGKPTRLLSVPQGSAAQQAQELVGGEIKVVSALHTVSADSLSDLDHGLDEDVLIASDDRQAKRTVASLLQTIEGLRPIDCGKLEQARLLEALTPLLISVNIRYKTHAGVRLSGLPDKLW
jgi:8-hydroxy-5-deazaflavin:NADPH oxidoreductase